MNTKTFIYILLFALWGLLSCQREYNVRDQINSMLSETGIHLVYVPVTCNNDTIWHLVSPNDEICSLFSYNELVKKIENQQPFIVSSELFTKLSEEQIIIVPEIKEYCQLHGIESALEKYDLNKVNSEQLFYLGLLCWQHHIFIYLGCEDATWHIITPIQRYKISCKKHQDITYYPTGEVHEINKIVNLKDSTYLTTIYYKNGEVKEWGYKNKNKKKTNKWYEYYSDGTFKYTTQYTTQHKVTQHQIDNYYFYNDYKNFVKYMEFSTGEKIEPYTHNKIMPKSYYEFRIIADSIHPDLFTVLYRYDTSEGFYIVPKIEDEENAFTHVIYVEDRENIEIALVYPRPQDIKITDTKTSTTAEICQVIPENFLQHMDTTSVRWFYYID